MRPRRPVRRCDKCGELHVRLEGGRATCNAHRRDGGPCTQYPVGGAFGTVCRMHGGSTKAYRGKVDERRTTYVVERELGRLLQEFYGIEPPGAGP